MVPNDTIPSVMNYANSCTALKAAPTCEQVRAGVIPLDSLPAAWWNCMWYDTNKAVNCTRYALTSIIQEINSVLAAAGRQVDQCCVDQLYESIEGIRQTIGTNLYAGAVKSSSTGGQVSIDGTTGMMTVNGVGNAASLTTSSHTVVNAINELNQVYTGCINALVTNIDTVDNIKANTAHAVEQTSYGVGNAADYGHLKISDTYDCCVGAAVDGLTASQKAVSDMYNYYASMQSTDKECACRINPSIVSINAFNCPEEYAIGTTTSGFSELYCIPGLYKGNSGENALYLGNVCCPSIISTCFQGANCTITFGSSWNACTYCYTSTSASMYVPNATDYYYTNQYFSSVGLYLFRTMIAQVGNQRIRSCSSSSDCCLNTDALYGELPQQWNCCRGYITCRPNFSGAVIFNYWSGIPLFTYCCRSMYGTISMNCLWDCLDCTIKVNNCTLIHCRCLYDYQPFQSGYYAAAYTTKHCSSDYCPAIHVNFNLYMLPFACSCELDKYQAAYLGGRVSRECVNTEGIIWYTPPQCIRPNTQFNSCSENCYVMYNYAEGGISRCARMGDCGCFCAPLLWCFMSLGCHFFNYACRCPPYTWMQCFTYYMNACHSTRQAIELAHCNCFASQPPIYHFYIES